ncbi:hypothetical protein O9H85_19030 [Paenibacillus filicis]|uniref:Uncharacterized protein n=1 Tax=Paenibacillus gyeongsangnamensis TaxID=3388067 RepID=A0ABT4QCG5_9BACL|nr:hypothetical protein [Paenibacillus filicis]MCZ8514476.1 hypothetical protein [Paenibacillus filicis]
MKRVIYRAQMKEGREAAVLEGIRQGRYARPYVDGDRLMTAAVYRWERNLFLYMECMEGEPVPEELVGRVHKDLEDWPGQAEKRKWVPMADVFHFNEPVSAEHWRRKSPVERRGGRVAHLKPEMIGSYIYYHYQLQEERAFPGEKYEIIAMHENLLFGYQEFPKVMEEPLSSKKLQTKGTPENWADARMDLHFQPWPDGHLYFKPIDPVFALYYEDMANE